MISIAKQKAKTFHDFR